MEDGLQKACLEEVCLEGNGLKEACIEETCLVEDGLHEACPEEASLEENGLKESWLEKSCVEKDGLKEGCLGEAVSRGRGASGWGGGGILLFTPRFRFHYYFLLDTLKLYLLPRSIFIVLS